MGHVTHPALSRGARPALGGTRRASRVGWDARGTPPQHADAPHAPHGRMGEVQRAHTAAPRRVAHCMLGALCARHGAGLHAVRLPQPHCAAWKDGCRARTQCPALMVLGGGGTRADGDRGGADRGGEVAARRDSTISARRGWLRLRTTRAVALYPLKLLSHKI